MRVSICSTDGHRFMKSYGLQLANFGITEVGRKRSVELPGECSALFDLCRAVGGEVIVGVDGESNDPYIEIYDGYRE